MEIDAIVDLFRSGLLLVVMIVSAIIIPGLAIGLVISVFQAATQINEQTLSFIPRLLITMLAIFLLGPWIILRLTEFTKELINNILIVIV